MPALDRMRVLDMTQYEAGTSCTQALAWLGADVVKIEQPGVGDPGRGVATGSMNSPYFINWNSNKRSVTLNLREARGRALLLEMLPHYDVFVENYGPGVMENLNLTYDVMQEVNPTIIYARLKGFGLSGPWSGYKCFDPIAQAAAGAFSVTGEAGGIPIYPGPSTGDSGTGVELALAITAAYVQKLQTGEGQEIEISMQEAMTYYMRTRIAVAGFGEEPAQRSGNSWGGPTDLYPCKAANGSNGANDYVYLIATTTRMWDSLCVAIDRADLVIDPRFENEWDRRSNADELKVEIAAWTMQRTKWEAMDQLGEVGVPAGAVLDTHDLFNNPHFEERGFVHTLDHPEHGKSACSAGPRGSPAATSRCAARRSSASTPAKCSATTSASTPRRCKPSKPPASSAAPPRSAENNSSPRGGAVAKRLRGRPPPCHPPPTANTRHSSGASPRSCPRAGCRP